MADAPANLRLSENATRRRYEAHLGEVLAGRSYYRDHAPGVVNFFHTVVPPEFAGRGIATRLIRHELDETRRRGLKVVADCRFVRAFIARHADYHDLLAEAPSDEPDEAGQRREPSSST